MFDEFRKIENAVDESNGRLAHLVRQGLATHKEAIYRRKAQEHMRIAKTARDGQLQLPLALAGYYLKLADEQQKAPIDDASKRSS
jgi:hypothetical protein